MEEGPQRIAVYPHQPTPPGTVVTLAHQPGTFTVLASFVAYQGGKRRTAYIVLDERRHAHVCLNGWLTPFSWLAERIGELEAGVRELADLRAALRAAGEAEV